ncbi:hypothetical protein N657DRAFT_640937 [Parathielavia appendiculata]|uniref:Uncharacterized protein n=1 Tax=Parathielavia appendiculata TaxID=2587402 RepID=A0AAN6U5V6_9PEZI|nr:hypothetical protein N657DRAFT_640937 [Parathielavia appendiculata]
MYPLLAFRMLKLSAQPRGCVDPLRYEASPLPRPRISGLYAKTSPGSVTQGVISGERLPDGGEAIYIHYFVDFTRVSGRERADNGTLCTVYSVNPPASPTQCYRLLGKNATKNAANESCEIHHERRRRRRYPQISLLDSMLLAAPRMDKAEWN